MAAVSVGIRGNLIWTAFGALLPHGAILHAQSQAGSVRGVVFDRDFNAPLADVVVLVVETGQRATSGAQGNFVLPEVAPGRYTLSFSKEGYVRQVRSDVLVQPGALTDLSLSLAGEFTDMDEFVVQDILRTGSGSEAALLELRFETPALMDSISADLMSKAGASDAAGALRLVSGATVADGKFAVIRGLPDRYVSSQMNRVRLPSADEDKRAVELDQFPSAVLESVQVTKTFTPDQQGDASGGAVDVRLKGIPDESLMQFKIQLGANSNTTGRGDFLTYDGGGVDWDGFDDGGRDIQYENLGGNWDGAVGVTRDHAPVDYKLSFATGGKLDLEGGVRVGGFLSLFYERDSSFFDDGRDDSWWVESPGAPMTPQTNQGTPQQGDFKTALFDVEQASQSVQWGGLASFGIETERHKLGLSFLHTRSAEDTATLAEDTRGKEYFFPGYDPNNPTGPGNTPNELNAAPYLRLETLEYSERTTSTLQLRGEHRLDVGSAEFGESLRLREPTLSWRLSDSSASFDQPDKRQFGSLWLPASFNPGIPPFIPPSTSLPTHFPYKPAANFNYGNLQRTWKYIEENSRQYAADLEWPFEQWSGQEGSVKVGLFSDSVDREFDQDSFGNFGELGAFYEGEWDDPWSANFPFENHLITASTRDVDYDGTVDVDALYAMAQLPLNESLEVVGGARFERTNISVINDAEIDATWFPPGSTQEVVLGPGMADVDFSQRDALPSLGVIYTPLSELSVRASWSRTVARQTFKELTPISQQEFLGGPVFIGNPDLGMSSLENYDLRFDYTPYPGGLASLSWFYKAVDDPIEYVQRVQPFSYTTAVNYPEGRLQGLEFELRQDLGHSFESCKGLSVGVNATWIDARVDLPDDEIAAFNLPNIMAPRTSRDMTNAPEHLYNFFATYDIEQTGTQLALFYTITGDTLVAGAGQAGGNFVPDVYAKQYGALNMSISQRIGSHWRLQLQAKNLTDPDIEEVYRSKYIPGDVTKTSYSRGIEASLSLSASF